MKLQNIKTAIKAFWVIAINAPHIYCDDGQHSIVGNKVTVEKQINLLIAAVNNELEQQELLDEAKKIIP